MNIIFSFSGLGRAGNVRATKGSSSGLAEKADRRRASALNDAKFYDFSESLLGTKDNITQKREGARTPAHNFWNFAQGVRARTAATVKSDAFGMVGDAARGRRFNAPTANKKAAPRKERPKVRF